MPKPTDVRIVDATYDTETIAYRTPIKFGGRVVSDAVLVNVHIEVETRDGRRGKGFGSMPMGNAWGWPSSVITGSETLAAIVELAKKYTAAANDGSTGHPLEITHRLGKHLSGFAAQVVGDAQLAEPMPRLAQLVAASPTDAAIFDAFGKAHRQNSYDLLGPEWIGPDLASFLTNNFAGEYLDAYTLREPKPTIPLYHLVGALDPLTDADLSQRINDGLPETLPEWIAADGLTHLKIKLNGDDLAWDVQRVLSVDAIASESRQPTKSVPWSYSTDFNERCDNVDYVLEFLEKIKEKSPLAFDRIHYIEQPTHRDLKAHPENQMHQAAKIKPVVIDESLIDLESLLLCRELGYSGVALKACKGHGEALLMGAAAQKLGMFLCVQDLTCPGASFLHSASLAARIPGVAAIEGNGRQYCPAGNLGWEDRYPSMFQITDGTVGTAVLTGPGLGFGE